MARLFFKLAFLVLIAAIGIGYYQRYQSDQLTQKIIEWGKQNQLKTDDIKRQDFKVEFNEAEWKSLVNKLDSTRYFDQLDGVPAFSFGFNPDYAKELVNYWRKSFDWRKQVQRLNKYTQYRVTINNTVIHYIYHETNPDQRHTKSPQPEINLMLIDGWPGCSFLFHKMIEQIETQFKDISFRIFVPSIPGYGYSSPLNRIVSAADTALLFDALMRYENADTYFIHGEDWGSLVATNMAQLFPDRAKGIHNTLPAFSTEFSSIFDFAQYLFGQFFPSTYYTEKEIKLNFPQRYSIWSRLGAFWSALGYFHLQSTKPDTVAHGLTDSPVGLLAYVLEKYSSWSFDFDTQIVGKRDGGLEKFDKDELLSIITIYWMTNSISSSVRYYKVNIERAFGSNDISSGMETSRVSSQVKVGIQVMNNEIVVCPFGVSKIKFPNLIQFEIVENAGHFAGFEKPKETAYNFVRFVLAAHS